jgi:hypothetical protein
MLGFGLWRLSRAEAKALSSTEGHGAEAVPAGNAANDSIVCERATTSGVLDPAEPPLILHRFLYRQTRPPLSLSRERPHRHQQSF